MENIAEKLRRKLEIRNFRVILKNFKKKKSEYGKDFLAKFLVLENAAGNF